MKDETGDAHDQPSSGSSRGGPRTPQGKQRSRRNAVRSGIFARVVLDAGAFREGQKDFKELLTALQQSLRPADPFEAMLVETLALEFLRLARLYQADAATAPLLFSKMRSGLEGDGVEAVVSGVLGDKPSDQKYFAGADLLLRYESSIWRQIDRILDRLDRWRESRMVEGNE